MKSLLKRKDQVFMQRVKVQAYNQVRTIKRNIEDKEDEKKTLFINSETNFWKSLFRIL